MNTSFEYGKTLAGEGSILLILSLVPYVGWVLGIIGVILLLKGIKGLSDYYQDDEIYKNSLTGVKFYVIALVAVAVAISSLIIGASITNFAGFRGFGSFGGFGNVSFAIGITTFIVGLILAFVFYILAASYLRKSLDILAKNSGEHSFATAATLLWVGAILTIVLVGLLLIFIAWIFAVIGFFSMRSQQQQPSASQQYIYNRHSAQSVTKAQQSTRYCSNCGASVASDVSYCTRCGKKLARD